MRFKKGSKVEVFTKKDMTCCGWRCGKIVSGNGQFYSVKFDCNLTVSGEDCAERVARKVIRPCPPLVDGAECWSAGDVMEVFHEFCWKTAVILEVLRRNWYLVRLIGSSKELKVRNIHVRTRLLWKDGQWIVINTGSGICDCKSNKLPTRYTIRKISSSMPLSEAERRMQAGEVCLATENNTGFQESYIFSGKTFKRQSPFWSSVAESSNGKTHKVRAIEKNGERQRMLSRHPSLFSEKVDAVAFPQACLGEKFIYAPPENGHYELEREIPNYFIEDFHERSSEPKECDIDTCSVGSCTVASFRPNKPCSPILVGNNPEAETLSSDAESFYHGDNGERCSFPLGEDVAARIHRLELHAYRCTLDALYASGPLSWEQEALLTNLRISLNISNDEHLMELRDLISAGTTIQIRAAVGGMLPNVCLIMMLGLPQFLGTAKLGQYLQLVVYCYGRSRANEDLAAIALMIVFSLFFYQNY